MRTLLTRLSAWRRDRRRQRNLRLAAQRGRLLPQLPQLPKLPLDGGSAALTLAVAMLALAAAGAALLWRHAQSLAGELDAGPASSVAALQVVAPGLRFEVSNAPGVDVRTVAGGKLLLVSGMRGGPLVRVDLCARPLPLQVGYRFSEVLGEPALRHALLVDEGSQVPAMTISASGDSLRVRWRERGSAAQWIADAPGAALRTQGWLLWADGGLRVERRAARGCAQGEMVVQAFSATPGQAGAAHVVGFPLNGAPLSLRLAAGRYEVPAAVMAAREDEVLFQRLRERGLLRLGDDGLLDLAPPDLGRWLAAPQEQRAIELPAWRDLLPDEGMRKLLQRLYRQADGEYVRRQVDLFNSERRLLAWRLPAAASAASASVDLQATGGGQLQQSAEMPALAVRLFADLPQGWQPWQRAAHWAGRGQATLVLRLAQPARGTERIDLLLAGQLAGAAPGATLSLANACSGVACRTPAEVQVVSVRPSAGVIRIELPVRALNVAGAQHPGDQAYRHIRLVGGAPAWQAIPPAAYAAGQRSAAAEGGGSTPAAVAAGDQITDRAGIPLWTGGAATPAARGAGLETLLGVGPAHTASLSGMLARAAALEGGARAARLTISLPLQALGQAILECQGLRGGSWNGKGCTGGSAAPAQRRAGLLLLDADNGDILLAAGAGGPEVTPGNWREARDFDRANPARSPLRLPAWQHDGGAHHSPGSAFKIISALGLEMAARHDRVLDGLLGGLPLAEIDQLARQRAYAFRTDAPGYPADTTAAHVTNYREQSVARRAEAGRLGLAQALTYSVNTWFAWSAELSDRTLQGRADGGAPGLRALEEGALAAQRPIAEAARVLGFGTPMRLDGGLLPAAFPWQSYDALQSSASRIDPIDSRHELRQMAIGLRMQATPLQMAVAAAAIGSGQQRAPRLLAALGARSAQDAEGQPLPVRLDRIRQGMKGVVDSGTAAGAFSGPALAQVRRGLYGKTGTAPVSDDAATVWFVGWLEPGSLPRQTRRLAFAAFVSHSQLTGGAHAAPMVAALLKAMAGQNGEQTGNPPSFAANGWAAAVP